MLCVCLLYYVEKGSLQMCWRLWAFTESMLKDSAGPDLIAWTFKSREICSDQVREIQAAGGTWPTFEREHRGQTLGTKTKSMSDSQPKNRDCSSTTIRNWLWPAPGLSWEMDSSAEPPVGYAFLSAFPFHDYEQFSQRAGWAKGLLTFRILG